MNVENARQLKRDLEQSIEQSISVFQQATGLGVDRVHCESFTTIGGSPSATVTVEQAAVIERLAELTARVEAMERLRTPPPPPRSTMSTPRKATPSDWAWLEGNSTVDRCDAAWSRGLIEHRARLEAMEAAMPMVLQPLTEVREFIPAPVTHDLANAAPLLWVLWNHLGGSSPIGQPIRQYLGMGQFERMTEDQIEAAKQYRDCMAMPTAPSPADSLVELEVAQQQPEPIDEAENDRRFHACMDLIQNATPEQIRAATGLPERSALVKRVDPAAIREVADWLDSIELHVAAARLRQEAQP